MSENSSVTRNPDNLEEYYNRAIEEITILRSDKTALEKQLFSLQQKPFYRSQKFWYTVGTVVATIVSHYAGLPQELVLGLFVSGATLVLGQGAADLGKNRKP